MKVLIIEDERLAQEYLENLLLDTGYEIEVVGVCDSLKHAIKWLIRNAEPDLIFMDIDLGDGLCFEIFEVVDITCPIIFTTAYDEYAIQAFKVNSIDYLLKPISSVELIKALNKYNRLSANVIDEKRFDAVASMLSEKYKSRFIIKVGQHIRSLPVENILFFESRDKATYAFDIEGRNSLIECSLDRLDSILDPVIFFRINRNYLISFKSIKEIISYSGSRLKVSLAMTEGEDIVVSRDRVNDFKLWLDI
ncbi:MAG: response regulator transcription factor [Saprospiraceae bacterium]|nr:response regulator transcription factor [Saprospiraceae bacterium]